MFYDGAKLRWANRRVHTANVIFGEVLYAPGGFCGPRIQKHFELVVFHSGDCQVRVDGAERYLTAGQVYLFLPRCPEHFRFAPERETHHSYCSVAPAFLPEDIKERLKQVPCTVPQSEVFRLLLATAFKLRTPRHRATQRLIDYLGIALFAEYLHSAVLAERERSQDGAVRRFLDYVDDHFAEETCLEGAHRVAGLSRNTLIYKLRAEKQTTPARYIWRARTERGVAMLAETGHRVAEIAYRCGFRNPFHFSRLVKQHLGSSPREIRDRAWSGRAFEHTSAKAQ